MSYDRNDSPPHIPGLRLLPWTGSDGKPCYLSADGPRSPMSRLADDIEADQLLDGAEVLRGARAVLDDHGAGEHALRVALRAATQSLRDVLRVADSRGARLPGAEGDDEPGDHDVPDDEKPGGDAPPPRLPTGAYG